MMMRIVDLVAMHLYTTHGEWSELYACQTTTTTSMDTACTGTRVCTPQSH